MNTNHEPTQDGFPTQAIVRVGALITLLLGLLFLLTLLHTWPTY